MKLVLFILIFPGVSYGIMTPGDTICNATHNTSQCTVTLGGNIYIQVMNNSTGYRLHLKKLLPNGDSEVFTVKRGTVRISNAFKNRTEVFVNNGTFKIQNVQREDAGQYTGEIYDTNGVFLWKLHVKLDVKENYWPIVVIVSGSVAALLIVMVMSFCICKKVRTRKQSGSGV